MKAATRRELLAAALRGAWGVGVWGALAGLACDTAPEPSLAAWLSSFESGRELGERYLEAHPEEASAERLEAEIFGRDSGGLPGIPRRELESALAARIQADFAAERVVRVDRWLLSETEARLFARAALERGSE